MKGFKLHLRLKEDCIFSEINASEGGHKGLDYIPGGALLGAAASALYHAISHECAFDLFHSGKVRFNNAYPISNSGQRSYPIPLCWHSAKGGETYQHKDDANYLIADAVWRLDQCEQGKLPEAKQPQQVRQGYIALDGCMAQSTKSFRMKTAIDANAGRAKEAALFAYDALNAGQCFYTEVHLDKDIDTALLEQLKQVFESTLLLGRSRSAEYGKVISQIADLDTPINQPFDNQATEITLWLQADLMVLDRYGQANLNPSSVDLGLPNGRFIAEKSFIRTRHYSLWNAYKHCPEMERQVISKGSILVYELDKPLEQQHYELITSGLGLERATGLGQVWLNPPLLDSLQPQFNKTAHSSPCFITTESSANISIENPNTPLIKWLEKQAKQKSNDAILNKQVKEVAQQYHQLLRSSCQLQGIDLSIHIGPSLSQWGNALDAAKQSGDISLHLFMGENAACKDTAKGWQDEYWNQDSEKIASFLKWFKERLEQQFNQERNHHRNAYFTQRLIREIMAILKEKF